MSPLAWFLVVLLILIILFLGAYINGLNRTIEALFYELTQSYEHPDRFEGIFIDPSDFDSEYPERIEFKNGFDYILDFGGDED